MNKVLRLVCWCWLVVLCGSHFGRVYGQAFTHPGLLHTEADFARMRTKVNAGAQPWKGSWDILVANPRSQTTWNPRPVATVIRGGTGQNYAQFYPDVHAAYQSALRWKISGDAAYANQSIRIMNAWSAVLTGIGGNADRFLAAGIYGYQFANAAEIMRTYPGWASEDFTRFKNMMRNVFYPMNHDFLVRHNDACISNYWANWDLCNMASILAIGVLCDDRTIYNEAVAYFKTGGGNGSIMNAVPFLHAPGLGQWQESGRDQAHSIMGIGLMGSFCEMAWNQGDDMYGYSNNRFMAGAEYVARYNTGNEVPFTPYWWGSGQTCARNHQDVVSGASRGEGRPVWEMVYHHYANRVGLSVPNLAAITAMVRPEGGGGNYGTASGGFDQLGFGSLTFARDALPAAGTYTLKNRASGKVLDNLGSTANGANVAQWSGPNGSNNQKWVLSYTSGYAKLVCVTGNRFLDSYGRTANGSNVAQWANSTSPNQQWTLENLDNGYYKIINRANGKCLDTGGGTADGAVMQFWGSGTSFNQQWSFTVVPGAPPASALPVAGTYTLKNRASGKVLDNLGSTTNGTDVGQMTGPDGSNDQKWVLSYTNGYAKLMCVTGSQYLDSINHNTDGSTVAQWAGSTSRNQEWIIESVGDGYYRLINVPNGKCLDTGGGTADGTVMQFWFPNPSTNQQWSFTPAPAAASVNSS